MHIVVVEIQVKTEKVEGLSLPFSMHRTASLNLELSGLISCSRKLIQPDLSYMKCIAALLMLTYTN